MRTLLTTALSVLGIYGLSQSNKPVDNNIPTQIVSPYYQSEDVELRSKGYTNSPSNVATEKLYIPKYEDRTSGYVDNMNKSKKIVRNNEGHTLEKIIDEGKNKIDINGGYVRANEAYTRNKDGTLTPKQTYYKPSVNNEDYNASIKEQESRNNFKNIKNGSKEILPLILILLLIVALIYSTIFLHKKIKTKSV